MSEIRKAEQGNYWKTTVHWARSQGNIMAMLEDFGSTNMMITQGRAAEKTAWLIRFEWRGQSYRFVFIPLECEHPERVTNFGGKRRRHPEQARYQMGRIAVHFVKAILTAAEAQPHALFGFLELSEAGMHPGGVPMTTGELDVSGLVRALPTWAIEPFLLEDGV